MSDGVGAGPTPDAPPGSTPPPAPSPTADDTAPDDSAADEAGPDQPDPNQTEPDRAEHGDGDGAGRTASRSDDVAPASVPRSDADLLQAHVEGDPDAFSTLVERHQDRLWAVALRVMGSPDDAADALQDAYVAAFRRAATFRGDAKVTTWLHRVVVNACLDRLRRAKVRPTSPLPDDLERAGLPEQAPERDALEEQEQRDAVARALTTLNPDQRAALVLVDMQGYSVEEAAAVLGCAPGTVKSRCARGRAKLVPLLSHLRDPPPERQGAPP